MASDAIRPPALVAAIEACPLQPWQGNPWRCHRRRWPADDSAGSLLVTGRYHRGRDHYAADQTWPALYLGLAPHIALGEALRHTRHLVDLAGKRISRLELRFNAVIDATALIAANASGQSTLDDLCRPADYGLTHAIARAVRARGAEALVIPTCARFQGDNLVVFPDLLAPGSAIVVVSSEDPDLYVEWETLGHER